MGSMAHKMTLLTFFGQRSIQHVAMVSKAFKDEHDDHENPNVCTTFGSSDVQKVVQGSSTISNSRPYWQYKRAPQKNRKRVAKDEADAVGSCQKMLKCSEKCTAEQFLHAPQICQTCSTSWRGRRWPSASKGRGLGEYVTQNLSRAVQR